jgi:hypothetical protein
MQSKLPLLHSCPGGIRKSTFHGPWHRQSAAPRPRLQVELSLNNSWLGFPFLDFQASFFFICVHPCSSVVNDLFPIRAHS